MSDISIINACKLVGYDVCFRASILAYVPVETITPDKNTIENVRCMVNRGLAFIKKYGPIVLDGFTFEGGGYSEVITSGDGDYLTKDVLWDFKVSKGKPSAHNALQLLIYYVMGLHSKHSEFKQIKQLGIYNPRLNITYLHKIKDINPSMIEDIAKDIIGYGTKFKDWLQNAQRQGLLINSAYKSIPSFR